VITKKDQTSFHVDYNHPLAGQELKFDVHVLGLQKFSVFETVDIPWIEDHDTAMDRAVREEKPLVLVLYADWCQWSQRLLNATFADPRIKRFHDRFVWLKIDSDKERVFKEVFEQENFPMIVLMDSSGEIVERMGGSRMGAPCPWNWIGCWRVRLTRRPQPEPPPGIPVLRPRIANPRNKGRWVFSLMGFPPHPGPLPDGARGRRDGASYGRMEHQCWPMRRESVVVYETAAETSLAP
jgi:hypothetical protein